MCPLQITWEGYSATKRELKRLKITLFKNVYLRLIEDIDKANKDLREISHQTICLEPIRTKRRSKVPIADLKLTRARARSLHDILVTGKAWRCRCQPDHVISLRLDIENSNTSGLRREEFRFLVSKGKDSAERSSEIGWLEFRMVTIVEDCRSAIHPQLDRPVQR